MSPGSRILAIVPAFNEERAISRVIAEIQAVRPPVDVLVVDDGSSDRTREHALASGCAVVSLPFNLGIGGAVQTGFRYAVVHDYDVAVQVDGDGQHVASEISVLLDVMHGRQADVVIGSRFMERKGYKASFARKLGIFVFVTVNSLLLRKRITDNTSGFRAYNRKAIRFLSENYPQDYPEPESVIILGKNGFSIEETAVHMREREHGQSSIGAVRSVYYMVKVLLAIFVDVFKEPNHR
ncbi:glycosyltransferase family 2 protein [bacterium]|nr:glycosyltransferase family 2 protein [bacterium]